MVEEGTLRERERQAGFGKNEGIKRRLSPELQPNMYVWHFLECLTLSFGGILKFEPTFERTKAPTRTAYRTIRFGTVCHTPPNVNYRIHLQVVGNGRYKVHALYLPDKHTPILRAS